MLIINSINIFKKTFIFFVVIIQLTVIFNCSDSPIAINKNNLKDSAVLAFSNINQKYVVKSSKNCKNKIIVFDSIFNYLNKIEINSTDTLYQVLIPANHFKLNSFVQNASIIFQLFSNVKIDYVVEITTQRHQKQLDEIFKKVKKFRMHKQVYFYSKEIMILQQLKRKNSEALILCPIFNDVRKEIGLLGFMPQGIFINTSKAAKSFGQNSKLVNKAICLVPNIPNTLLIDTLHYEKIIN